MAAGDLVGLIPAAGRARRLGRLPCSKEILPLAVRDDLPGRRLRVACDCLLELLRDAGAARAFVLLGEEKSDVLRYLGGGEAWGVPLAYLTLADSPSLPHSLDRAYPFVRDARVALGFPDVQLGPAHALALMAAEQAASGADVVLGLVAAARPQTTDMVELDAAGRVARIEVRPSQTSLQLCWVAAIWGPAFTEHLHRRVAAADARDADSREGDRDRADGADALQIGDVMAAALTAGLDVRGVELPGGWYLDVGTPDGLREVLGVRGPWLV